jgi:magnesium transporter
LLTCASLYYDNTFRMSVRASSSLSLDATLAQVMRREYASLSARDSVEQALATLRTCTLPNQIIYFYVIDEHGRLIGVVPTRKLLMSPLHARIADIALGKVIALPMQASVSDACELFILHRFLALPIIDEQRRLVGVVDIGLFTDEMEQLSQREKVADVFQLIGVKLESGKSHSPWQSFRLRFPWLTSNIMGGILCAIISSWYETLLSEKIILALFIPVVLALSESISIQSLTLTIQRLHGGKLRLFSTLARELQTGVLLGSAAGLTVGAVVLIWKSAAATAGIIALSIACAMIAASVLGVLLPMLIRRFGRDPRVAAGPLLYFNLASWLLAG